MAEKKEPQLTFEAALERLEEITAELESESISLDRSLELFAEGQSLARFCEQRLAEVEEKVKTLVETPEGLEEKPGLRGD